MSPMVLERGISTFDCRFAYVEKNPGGETRRHLRVGLSGGEEITLPFDDLRLSAFEVEDPKISLLLEVSEGRDEPRVVRLSFGSIEPIQRFCRSCPRSFFAGDEELAELLGAPAGEIPPRLETQKNLWGGSVCLI